MISAQKETLEILSVFPPDKAFRISSGIYQEFTEPCSPITKQVPRTVIFTSDGINHACSKLYDILKTPDSKPLPFASLEATIQRQLRLLVIRDASRIGMSQSNLARQCLKAVAGKQDEEDINGKNIVIYKDIARLFPQYAWSWLNDLRRQFGHPQIKDAQNDERQWHFFAILWATQGIATYFPPTEPLPKKGLREALHDIFQRTYETIDLLGPEKTSSLLKQQADKKFAEYRKYTYLLRGLTLDYSN